MNHDLRLPHNAKEGLLYGVIICGITALIMATFNIYLQIGSFNSDLLFAVLKAYPLFFIIALLLETLVMHRGVEKLVQKFTGESDSFNAVILFTVLFTVIGMSFTMTIIGDFIGHGFQVEEGFLGRFTTAWPRNFSIVLFIELVIAQPLARKAMKHQHRHHVAQFEELIEE